MLIYYKIQFFIVKVYNINNYNFKLITFIFLNII